MEWKLKESDFVRFIRHLEKGRETVRDQKTYGFFGHELKKGRSLSIPVSSLEEIPFLVGMSTDGLLPLRGRKERVSLELYNIAPFGTIQVRGAWEVELAGKKGALRKGNFQIHQSSLRGEPVSLFSSTVRLKEGRMILYQNFDLEKQRIDSLKVWLRARSASSENPGENESLSVNHTYYFLDVYSPGYRGFESDVAEAIRKGVAAIQARLPQRASLWGGDPPGSRNQANTGLLALSLLTLLKCGAPESEPVVHSLLDEVRTRDIRSTYALGLALMALDALYEHPKERELIRSGRIDRPAKRKVSESDKKLMEKLLACLLENAGGPSPRGISRWGYQGESTHYDNSNTQYAVLGLRSAHLCDCPIPETYLLGILQHFLREQEQSGPEVESFTLRTYRDQLEKSRYAAPKIREARAKGWSYQARGMAYGSMTTAGLTGLSIALDILQEKGKLAKTMNKKVRSALLDGFAWMKTHYSLRENPRMGSKWYYYYLYGLERACEIAGVTHIDEHDWYFDGAMLLLSQQNPDGSWGDLADTCFALLFLKKATLPGTTLAR